MSEELKENEINRLTSPFHIKNKRLSDSKGNYIRCIERFSEIEYVIEPDEDLLTDDEILEYAPDSKAGSKVRLKTGDCSLSDKINIYNSLFWQMGLYYTILLSFAALIFHTANWFLCLLTVVLLALPLVYLIHILFIKDYRETIVDNTIQTTSPIDSTCNNQFIQLKNRYDNTEAVVLDLIEKNFEPPQITYDNFMAIVENSNKLFYRQYDVVMELSVLDGEKIDFEIEEKIKTLNLFIEKLNELRDELVINLSNTDSNVSDLFDEMDELIKSVNDYD